MASHAPRHAGPVAVTVVQPQARHAFDHPSDPRIVLDGKAPPQVVMVPAVRLTELAAAPALVSADLGERIRTGRAVLVLDASGEGAAFSHDLARAIHRLLRELRAPARHVAYLTQNRDFEAAYRAWCGDGVIPVKVFVHDAYLSRFFHGRIDDGPEVYAARLAAFEARAERREKRFLCLNYSLRTAKVLLLLALVRDGLWDKGVISFPGFDEGAHVRAVRKSAMADDLVRLQGLEAVGEELLLWLDALEAKGASMLGARPGKTHLKAVAADSALDEYNQVWFSMINETEVMGTRRVTEKPFKALANFSPLLLWGNPGSLDLIHQFGFRTFDGFVDESYDAEPDPRRRFEMVYGELKRLCAAPEAELLAGERAMSETLAFNAERALTVMPRLYRQKIEPRLLDAVLDLAPKRLSA